MAITILQEPTSPNLPNADLIYTVSSSNAGSPQFRYLVEMTDQYTWGNIDVDFKVYPNIEGVGNFNVSRFIQDSRIPSSNGYYQSISRFMGGSVVGLLEVLPEFTFDFKEEYAADLDSTPVTSSVLATSTIFTLPAGYKNINNNTGTGYNFDSGSYYYVSTPVDLLTTNPSQYAINPKDVDFKYELPFNCGCPYSVISDLSDTLIITITGYNSYDNVVTTDTYTWPGGGVTPVRRTTNVAPRFMTISALFPNIAAAISAGIVEYYAVSSNLTNKSFKIYPNYTNCNGAAVPYSLGWIDERGTLEVFSPFTPLKRTTDITRNEYDRTFVRYEDFLPSYNQSNRGKTQYKTEYSDTFEFTTNWLNQEQANWLSGLFESETVLFNQRQSPPTINDIIPIIITNSSYIVNNSTARNKLFQYTVQFKYSLQRPSR